MKKLLLIIFTSPFLVEGQTTGGGFPSITSTLSIGTTANTAPITATNFSSAFPNPQTGTMVHLVSDAVTNGRISFDTYNTSSSGSNYQGRKGRGSAGSPSSPIADDILVAVGGDGYGETGFHNISLGGTTLRSEGTMTDASAPTYFTISTTPTGTITQTERLRVLSTGQVRLLSYGSNTFTGTPTKSLQVDANGNIIEGALGGSASWGGITGTLSDQTDLQTALNTKLATNGNGSSLTGLTASQVGLGNVTNESKATMFTSPTFTGTVSGVTASMVGLGNVTNESKATMFTNATFTGTFTAPNTTITNAMLAGSIDLTSKVTGVLPSANGGTGIDNGGRTLTVSTNSGTLAFPAAATTHTFPSVTSKVGNYILVATLGSDQATGADVNPVTLTGLVFTYEANSIYQISFLGRVSPAAATTGCGFQFDMSSAVTEIDVSFYHQLANTGTLSGGHSIADDASVGVSSGMPGTSTYPVTGSGMIRTGANTGTAQLRFRSETTAVTTAKAGLTLIVEKIN